MEITIPRHHGGHAQAYDPIRLIGSAICRQCGAGTGFEIEANTLTYVAGAKSYGALNTKLPEIVKTLYAEAELCSQSGASNASSAMCRASIEAALTQTSFKGGNLYDQITSAQKAGALDEVEVGLAHATRLVTRDAIY